MKKAARPLAELNGAEVIAGTSPERNEEMDAPVAVEAVNEDESRDMIRGASAETLTPTMTREEARTITSRINETTEALWTLLRSAHERKAWLALGYKSWGEYVREELEMSRQRSYQLLDYARVREALEVSTAVDKLPVENVARPLAKLETPEEQRDAYAAAVEASPNGKPTLKEVQAAVEKERPTAIQYAVRRMMSPTNPGAPKGALERILHGKPRVPTMTGAAPPLSGCLPFTGGTWADAQAWVEPDASAQRAARRVNRRTYDSDEIIKCSFRVGPDGVVHEEWCEPANPSDGIFIKSVIQADRHTIEATKLYHRDAMLAVPKTCDDSSAQHGVELFPCAPPLVEVDQSETHEALCCAGGAR